MLNHKCIEECIGMTVQHLPTRKIKTPRNTDDT